MFKNTLETFTLLAGLAGFFVLVGTLLGGVSGLVIGGLLGFVSPDDQPNAFATGRNERTAIVCVTAGLLVALDRDELRGVVAHEAKFSNLFLTHPPTDARVQRLLADHRKVAVAR